MNVWKFNGRPPVRFRLNRQSDGKRLGIPTSTDARMADRFCFGGLDGDGGGEFLASTNAAAESLPWCERAPPRASPRERNENLPSWPATLGQD